MCAGLSEASHVRQELCDILGEGITPEQVFDMLDQDGDGGITIEEFCQQLMKSVWKYLSWLKTW